MMQQLAHLLACSCVQCPIDAQQSADGGLSAGQWHAWMGTRRKAWRKVCHAMASQPFNFTCAAHNSITLTTRPAGLPDAAMLWAAAAHGDDGRRAVAAGPWAGLIGVRPPSGLSDNLRTRPEGTRRPEGLPPVAPTRVGATSEPGRCLSSAAQPGRRRHAEMAWNGDSAVGCGTRASMMSAGGVRDRDGRCRSVCAAQKVAQAHGASFAFRRNFGTRV